MGLKGFSMPSVSSIFSTSKLTGEVKKHLPDVKKIIPKDVQNSISQSGFDLSMVNDIQNGSLDSLKSLDIEGKAQKQIDSINIPEINMDLNI